jgi:acyl carrier protein phosphodiesterase
MNFLAHMYLSGENDDIMIGNFIADHLKGNRFNRLREGIIEGIRLHRKIDGYTDIHPEFMKSKRRLQVHYHKYAGVITDMFYDHFLAANWNEFSAEALIPFTTRKYKVLMNNFLLLPARTKRLLPYIIGSNWLASYADLDFLHRSLQGIASRARYDSGMQYAIRDLERHYDLFGAEFRSFFPDLIDFVNEEMKVRNQP